jgi:hypothetical protein
MIEHFTTAFFHCFIFLSLVNLLQAACGQTLKIAANASELENNDVYHQSGKYNLKIWDYLNYLPW